MYIHTYNTLESEYKYPKKISINSYVKNIKLAKNYKYILKNVLKTVIYSIITETDAQIQRKILLTVSNLCFIIFRQYRSILVYQLFHYLPENFH